MSIPSGGKGDGITRGRRNHMDHYGASYAGGGQTTFLAGGKKRFRSPSLASQRKIRGGGKRLFVADGEKLWRS